jgi:hypothetical protein
LLPPSGVFGGKSPGTDDGNGDGRGAIGVTAGPGCVIGRDTDGAAARGGSFDFAAFALRAGFFAAAFFRRAGAARFFAAFFEVLFGAFLETFFFAFRFFAMVASSYWPPTRPFN